MREDDGTCRYIFCRNKRIDKILIFPFTNDEGKAYKTFSTFMCQDHLDLNLLRHKLYEAYKFVGEIERGEVIGMFVTMEGVKPPKNKINEVREPKLGVKSIEYLKRLEKIIEEKRNEK